MTINWTDPTVSSSVHIRAIHINELRSVVNQNRAAAGLAAYAWTDSPVSSAVHIRAVHFTELRSAIQDLWNHQGIGALPNWSYGSPPAPGGARPISARDTTDLRAWVQRYQVATGSTSDPLPQFGVDTTFPLNTLIWSSFKAWSGYYPSFAGRYFDVSYTWQGGEGTNAKAQTGGALAYIVPLQSSFPNNQSKTGSAGFSQGQVDANTTCLTILANINSGELAVPSSDMVYVYLDVASASDLSVDYWAGWADYVWHYNVNGLEPLFPALYAHFSTDDGTNYHLDQLLQNVLNNAPVAYPNNEVCCFGLWTFEPQPCVYCDQNPTITMPNYATYSQPCISGGRKVPMVIWQYAQYGASPAVSPPHGSGCQNDVCQRPSTIFGSQHVDLDRSFAPPDTSNMLVIR